MNAVSQALRIIAILGALAAGFFYYQSKTKLAQQSAAASQDQQALQVAQGKNGSLEQEKEALSGQLDKANANIADLQTQLAQARTDAGNAVRAAQDKDSQITDLTNQINTLKQGGGGTSSDDLKQQIATLQTENQNLQNQVNSQGSSPAKPAADNSAANTTTGSPSAATPAAGAAGTPATATAGTGSFPTTPSPASILEIDKKHGLLVLSAGSSGGLENNAQLVIQQPSGGDRLAQVVLSDTQPDFAVAIILDGSSLQQLSKGEAVEYVRVR